MNFLLLINSIAESKETVAFLSIIYPNIFYQVKTNKLIPCVDLIN